MTDSLPGLLQLWGVLLIAVIATVAFAVAYLWHRADRRRPALHLDVLALALLALLTGGFFWRVLTEAGVMMPTGGGDIASFYYPTYAYAAEEIKHGSLPLWNPYIFRGMPLAADVQSGLFYPINWVLYLFVDVDYGSLEWLLIFHYWLAAAFMYLFLRDLRLGRAAALGGRAGVRVLRLYDGAFRPSADDTGGGVDTGLSARYQEGAYHAGLGGWVWSVLAGVALAVSFLAGHAQVFSYGLLAVGLLWLYLLFEVSPLTWRDGLSWVAKGAVALVVLLGLCAVQLLPSLELSAQSVRSSISFEEAGAFSAQPITLINMFLPRVYGSNPSNYSPSDWQSTENWAYCGVITLALAAGGLVLRRSRMAGLRDPGGAGAADYGGQSVDY